MEVNIFCLHFWYCGKIIWPLAQQKKCGMKNIFIYFVVYIELKNIYTIGSTVE
jgi:hypothetical protein